MAENLPDHLPKVLIAALEEFSHSVNARNFQDHLTKMVFAFLQADDEAAQYDYSKDLWGQLDALFSLLAVLDDFQIAAKISGERHA